MEFKGISVNLSSVAISGSLAIGRRGIYGLHLRVDGLVGNLWIFGPVRNQTPLQSVQGALLSFRVEPDRKNLPSRSNVPTDRQTRCTTVSKQLHGHGWNIKQDPDAREERQ